MTIRDQSSPSDEEGSGATWAADVGLAIASSAIAKPDPPVEIDTSAPHPARRYDYWLGGKTHYAADRHSGDVVAKAFPGIRISAIENRRFLRRVVTVLARDHGIDQFLDIGTGIPSPGNTHEIAQAIHPQSRVLYVDNDPVVLAHANALLTSTPQGCTAYAHADLRHPESILRHRLFVETLDLSRPVGLLLIAVLHFLTDQDRPYRIVHDLVQVLPPGSFVALTHATYDRLPQQALNALSTNVTPQDGPFQPRSHPEFARFFTGLQLLPPGICRVHEWHPDTDRTPTTDQVAVYGALARTNTG